MSEPTRRFFKLFDGTMHESAHGDWIPYHVTETIIAQRDAFEKMSQMWKDHGDSIVAELIALRAERDALRKDAMGVVNVLGFFASCIKSGEPWTPQCEDMLRAAFAHRDAALAVQPTTESP